MKVFFSGVREPEQPYTPLRALDKAAVMVTYFELHKETARKEVVEAFKRHVKRRRKRK